MTIQISIVPYDVTILPMQRLVSMRHENPLIWPLSRVRVGVIVNVIEMARRFDLGKNMWPCRNCMHAMRMQQ